MSYATLKSKIEQLIEKAESGGSTSGDTINGMRYICGTFTPESNIKDTIEIDHEDLIEYGDKYLTFIFDGSIQSQTKLNAYAIIFIFESSYQASNTVSTTYMRKVNSTASGLTGSTAPMTTSNESKIQIRCSGSQILQASVPYHWIKIVLN